MVGSKQDGRGVRARPFFLASAILPVLTQVAVRRGIDDVTVVVEGDHPMAYKIIPVDTFRLVMDLPRVRTGLTFPELIVDHKILKKIRIGQHQDKLRLVFDLNLALMKDLKYGVKTRGNQVAVKLVKI